MLITRELKELREFVHYGGYFNREASSLLKEAVAKGEKTLRVSKNKSYDPDLG